jgi:hypothetical protein
MWELTGAERAVSLHPESLTMLPAASVSGLYFAHPKATYFSVGKIQRDQVLFQLFFFILGLKTWGSSRPHILETKIS